MKPNDNELASMTKDQIIARIEADPAFQREQAARAQSEFAQSLATASKPILNELSAIGIVTPSVELFRWQVLPGGNRRVRCVLEREIFNR